MCLEILDLIQGYSFLSVLSCETVLCYMLFVLFYVFLHLLRSVTVLRGRSVQSLFCVGMCVSELVYIGIHLQEC